MDDSYAERDLNVGFSGGEEEGGDAPADYAKARPCHSR